MKFDNNIENKHKLHLQKKTQLKHRLTNKNTFERGY